MPLRPARCSNRHSNSSNTSGACCLRASQAWALTTAPPAAFRTSSARVRHPLRLRRLPVPDGTPSPLCLSQTRYRLSIVCDFQGHCQGHASTCMTPGRYAVLTARHHRCFFWLLQLSDLGFRSRKEAEKLQVEERRLSFPPRLNPSVVS